MFAADSGDNLVIIPVVDESGVMLSDSGTDFHVDPATIVFTLPESQLE